MRQLWAWCRSHPILSSSIFLVLGLVAMHFALDAASERQWQRYREAARARGVAVEFDELGRQAVPDEENFAKIPLFQQAGGTVRVFDLKSAGLRPDLGDPLQQELPDWEKIRAHFQKLGWIQEATEQPARDVLQALERLDGPLRQWTEGLQRPYSQFPMDRQNLLASPRGHLTIFRDAARVFALRLGAKLESGDSAGAYLEWRSGWQSAAKFSDVPFLIDGVVVQSMYLQMLNAAGFGLLKRRWTEPELARLSEDLAGLNLLKERAAVFAGERTAFNAFFEHLMSTSQARRSMAIFTSNAAIDQMLSTVSPRRLIRDNQLRQNLWIDELLASVNPETGEYFPDAPTAHDPRRLKGPIEPSTFSS